MKYKVVLVEDQYVARQLFGLYLKDSEKYEIVRTLESASGIAELLRNVPVDLILMDILLDDHSNGMEGAARIKKERPGIKIIAIFQGDDPGWDGQNYEWRVCLSGSSSPYKAWSV